MALILVADDDAAMRELVARALTADGYTVATTADGQEAHDRLFGNAQAVDLLLADVQMPAMDGIDLVEKALAARPQLKVILMSGLTGELERAERLGDRGVKLLAKPFTLEALRGVVRGLVPQQ